MDKVCTHAGVGVTALNGTSSAFQSIRRALQRKGTEGSPRDAGHSRVPHPQEGYFTPSTSPALAGGAGAHKRSCDPLSSPITHEPANSRPKGHVCYLQLPACPGDLSSPLIPRHFCRLVQKVPVLAQAADSKTCINHSTPHPRGDKASASIPSPGLWCSTHGLKIWVRLVSFLLKLPWELKTRGTTADSCTQLRVLRSPKNKRSPQP